MANRGCTPMNFGNGRCGWSGSGRRRVGSPMVGTRRSPSSLASGARPWQWVRDEENEQGTHPGLSRDERSRIAELERENRELRRANEILKSAAAFFGAELDRRPKK